MHTVTYQRIHTHLFSPEVLGWIQNVLVLSELYCDLNLKPCGKSEPELIDSEGYVKNIPTAKQKELVQQVWVHMYVSMVFICVCMYTWYLCTCVCTAQQVCVHVYVCMVYVYVCMYELEILLESTL
jgi:hypothetical protein